MRGCKEKFISSHCILPSVLLDRVFLRLGNADSDEQLESCLTRFLPPVILKLTSPHEQVGSVDTVDWLEWSGGGFKKKKF